MSHLKRLISLTLIAVAFSSVSASTPTTALADIRTEAQQEVQQHEEGTYTVRLALSAHRHWWHWSPRASLVVTCPADHPVYDGWFQVNGKGFTIVGQPENSVFGAGTYYDPQSIIIKVQGRRFWHKKWYGYADMRCTR